MTEEPADAHAPQPQESRPVEPKPVKAGRALLIFVAAAAALAFSGVTSREHDAEKLAKRTNQLAIPTVALAEPQHETKDEELVLPGDVEAYYAAQIHSQVEGYVREWRFDIGAQVRQGDILAVVDTPEVDQRITESEGELAKAKANQALAQITADRWKGLRATSAVSEQAIDEKVGDLSAKDAEVAAAKANLDRLRALKAFAKITAPFDGVVTARDIDIGSLVMGSGSSSQPLFVVADIHKMRIYGPVPENYAALMKNGMSAEVFVPEYGERAFKATIDTTSHGIDQKSRSLLVELMADNPDELLKPGAFAQVHFQIPANPNAVMLPVSALLFRESMVQVALVGADNRVRLDKVHIARDYGAEVQISGGLPADARIIANPPESIAEGQEVRVAESPQVVAAGGPKPTGAGLAAADSGRE
jgi:RND family efflux transporter MFP subunit